MNDTEIKETISTVEKVEIQEVQTPIIAEKTEIKASKLRLFPFLKAKWALIIIVLCLILGIILTDTIQLEIWIKYFLLTTENFILSLFIKS